MTLMWAAEHRELVNMTFGADNITIATIQVHLGSAIYRQDPGCCLRGSLTAKLLQTAVSSNCRPGLLIYVWSLHHVKWKLFLTNDMSSSAV